MSHEHCRKCLFVFVFLVTKGSNNQRAGLRSSLSRFFLEARKKKKTRKIRKVPFLAPTLARLPSSTLPGRLAKLEETETTATQAFDERTTTTVTSTFFVPHHCITLYLHFNKYPCLNLKVDWPILLTTRNQFFLSKKDTLPGPACTKCPSWGDIRVIESQDRKWLKMYGSWRVRRLK